MMTSNRMDALRRTAAVIEANGGCGAPSRLPPALAGSSRRRTMTLSQSQPQADSNCNRLDLKGFARLLLSNRKLEWVRNYAGHDMAVLDRDRGDVFVTDRQAFERVWPRHREHY